VKEFENRLRFDKIIVTTGWRVFLGQSVLCLYLTFFRCLSCKPFHAINGNPF